MTTANFAGVATGIGSWPGTDIREATAIVFGELPVLPHLVELPARGIGSDMIGRTGAILVDIDLDARTSGYRTSSRRTNASRKGLDFLHEDLDVAEEVWESAGLAHTGKVLKVQVAGPLTMAAEVELANGHRLITDRGAVRFIAESLAEGLRSHCDEVAKRLGVDVLIQLDEPDLPAVLAGTLSGVTGVDTVPALPAPDALDVLDMVMERSGRPVLVHSCGVHPPLELVRRSAAVACGIDVSVLTRKDLDSVGELLQAGTVLMLGLVPSVEPDGDTTWRQLASPAVTLVDRLGFPRSILSSQISVTPSCGLASGTPEWARTALTHCKEIATAFAEDPESL